MNSQRRARHGVEIILDNRQVFLLFFGSTVILSLVFALGVAVGKRAERQGIPVAGADPLSLLDQMGGAGDVAEETLSFHDALGEAATRGEPLEDNSPAGADGTGAKGDTESARASRGTRRPPQSPQQQVRQRRAATMPAAAQGKAGDRRVTRGKYVEGRRGGATSASDGVSVEGNPGGNLQATAQAEAAPGYTLQLSAFQDRHEAQLFMAQLREAGLDPYVVATTIPGRGVWYRVRLGRYDSWEEALTAKQSFEQKQSIIAYVAKD